MIVEKIPEAEVEFEKFTLNTKVSDVINDPAFDGYGELLFPIDLNIDTNLTLNQISSSSTYVWYNNIDPNKTVEILNYLKEESLKGNKIFYHIYSDEEIKRDSSKRNVGLFFFRGLEDEKFAIVNAGGGFMYVGAMHDSFPHALELSKNGYNGFALIYRPDDPYSDLAKAIEFINDNASELKVDKENYSLWGGSAGARMAATVGNSSYLYQLTQRNDIDSAAAVIMQYTGYNYISEYDAPTYANVGTADGIASYVTMQNRIDRLNSMGIDAEIEVFSGLRHGYGIGTNTVAQGWIENAINFWEKHSK